jgi:hypothetical protein
MTGLVIGFFAGNGAGRLRKMDESCVGSGVSWLSRRPYMPILPSRALLVLILVSAILAGCGGRQRDEAGAREPPPPAGEVAVVSEAPPPERVEAITAAPSPEHVWIRGYWLRRGREWVWVPGHWERRHHAGAQWEQGHWVSTRRGWVWRPGHWR